MILRQSVCSLLLALVLPVVGGVCDLRGQQSDSTPATSSPQEIRLSLGGTIGLEWVNKESWGGRLYVGLPIGDYLYLPVTTFSLTHSAVDGKTRASMNPLFIIPLVAAAGLVSNSKPAGIVCLVLALPELIGNPTIRFPLVREHLFLTLSQRTDFYLFSEGAEIYTESAVGLRIRVARVSGELRYAWPLTKGYLQDKGPYVGASFYFGG